MRVALVNTNRINPPIAPIGLDYVAEALYSEGIDVEVLDLCWSEDWKIDTTNFFNTGSYDLVGITLRNTDDCAFASRQSFIDEFTFMVEWIRGHTDAPIVLGGAGYSVIPELILKNCKADAGIWGDGEVTIVEIARRLSKKNTWADIPNMLWYNGGALHRNPSVQRPLEDLPPMSRSWINNGRYFREGGQAGFETKRGCTGNCIYCADPVAKGKKIRVRPAKDVAFELERLYEQGIDHFHTCDSEFNMPMEHAVQVCRELIGRKLGEKLRWYAYCSPVPFSRELARLMRRAGCVGINFGVDNGDQEMLKLLKRDFASDDIVSTAQLCYDEGITVMFDLLLGAPGETERSIVNTIDLIKRAEPDQVGVSLGIRVYPGTALSAIVRDKKKSDGLVGGKNPLDPLFFLEPAIAPSVGELLERLIGNDKRFFFFDPTKPERNYNYNANTLLVEAIQQGYRGAYWDILRACIKS
jgi:hypothetical protein